MMSGKEGGKKSWAGMLLEGEGKETCQSCGIEFPPDQLKPYKLGSSTKMLCPDCISIEETKKQERARKREEARQREAPQPAPVSQGLQETLEKLNVAIASLPTRDEVNKILSMKDDIIAAVRKDSSPSIGMDRVDVVPTERAVLKELASSKLGYVSHFDTFRNRWGMHHSKAIKAILSKLWGEGILKRDIKGRHVLDPSISKEKVESILGEPVDQSMFDDMKKASEARMKASSTPYLTKKEHDSLPRKRKWT